jgi:hypothetical protein
VGVVHSRPSWLSCASAELANTSMWEKATNAFQSLHKLVSRCTIGSKHEATHHSVLGVSMCRTLAPAATVAQYCKASTNEVWKSSPAQRCNCWTSQRLPLPLPGCRWLSTCSLSFWPLCWLVVWHLQRHIRMRACAHTHRHRHHATPLLWSCAGPPHLQQKRHGLTQGDLAHNANWPPSSG